MATVNANPKVFDIGGSIVITKSGHASSPATVTNLIPGSFKFAESVPEPIRYSHAGVQQTPIGGTEPLVTFEFAFNAGRWVSADIRDLLMGLPSATTGEVYTFDTIEFTKVLGPGGTAAEQVTASTAWLTSLEQEAGAGTNGLDKWTAKFECKKADWDWSAT